MGVPVCTRPSSPERHRGDEVSEGQGLSGAVTTPCSLELEEGTGYETWEGLGVVLGQMEMSLPWWIGDWWNEGDRQFGEKHAQAVDAVGLAYATIRVYAWVAGKVEPRRRRASLSFGHHQVVAALKPKEQTEWLKRAEAEKWSRSQLHRELRDVGVAPEPPPQPQWSDDAQKAHSVALTEEEMRWLLSHLDGVVEPLGVRVREATARRLQLIEEERERKAA